MLNQQVIDDLELETVHTHIDLKTCWARTQFTKQLCSPPTTHLKRLQLPLLALVGTPDVRATIQRDLADIDTTAVDELVPVDSNNQLENESITQILWKPSSYGAFLNTHERVIHGLVTWKTILLPAFAILMPLLALIVPFFFLRWMNQGTAYDSSAYLTQVRTVLLQQISVPSILSKWKGTGNDRMGFLLESIFIGLTLAMFISSLWNQVASAYHFRTIWNNLLGKADAVSVFLDRAAAILQKLEGLPARKQDALHSVIAAGTQALATCKQIKAAGGISRYGTVWNDPVLLAPLKSWIAHIDILVGISSLPGICFPKHGTGLDIHGVYHPSIKSCVSNNYTSCRAHTILTGPNRGGKSTFCKSLGLAIVTAQSWGFAWADRMTFPPFQKIMTALESCGKLGHYSTFEAEIEFAKTVLAAASSAAAPIFVMMDEIFHSTNANDGVEASRVFMDQLYKHPHVFSLISTHYRELPEKYGDAVQTLQLESHLRDNGALEYTYKVAEGISTTSSVMEILVERGLVSGAVTGAK
jgi:hypothetical protein